MKTRFTIFSIFFFLTTIHSQNSIKNWDKNGKCHKSVSEYTEIIISQKKPGLSALKPILMGPAYSIFSSIVKNSLENRKKSFTGTYSNSAIINDPKDIDSIIVNRYAINKLEEIDSKHLATSIKMYVLPDEEANGLNINLASIKMAKSKAKYKSGNNLAISIAIKATYKKGEKSYSSDGTIIIPIATVSSDIQEFEKGVNKIFLDGIDFKSINYIQFSVTVTESNTSKLNPTIVQNLLTNNLNDLQTILKTILEEK